MTCVLELGCACESTCVRTMCGREMFMYAPIMVKVHIYESDNVYNLRGVCARVGAWGVLGCEWPEASASLPGCGNTFSYQPYFIQISSPT